MKFMLHDRHIYFGTNIRSVCYIENRLVLCIHRTRQRSIHKNALHFENFNLEFSGLHKTEICANALSLSLDIQTFVEHILNENPGIVLVLQWEIGLNEQCFCNIDKRLSFISRYFEVMFLRIYFFVLQRTF